MELTYRAFGLTFGSDLVLPGLPTCGAEAAVRIRRGVIPGWLGEPTVQYGERVRIRGQVCAIRFKALPFAGLVQDGNLIQFEADPAQDDVSSLHILGSCTGALLFQRGLIPLHGNAVETAHGAVVLAGKIGSGKSTTTLALIRRGYRLLADDISAISFGKTTPDGTRNGGPQSLSPQICPEVVPGFPRLKLWRNTIEQFGMDCGEYRRVRPGLDKFHIPMEGRFCEDPRKPDAIYILQPGDAAGVGIRVLSGVEKLQALRQHLYKVRFHDAIRNWPAVLTNICALADSIRVCVVERPSEGITTEAVADIVERDFSRKR